MTRTPTRTRSRVAAAGAAATLVLAWLAGTIAPAGADTAPGVVLKIGEKITKSYTVTGVAADELAKEDANGDLGTGAPPPDDCASSPSHGCLVIPLTLDVPASYFKTHDLALNITFSWGGDVGANTPLGVEETQTERGYLWQVPTPKDPNGNPVFDQYDFGANPGFISQVSFNTKTFFIELMQTRSQGVPQPVKVVYAFQDLTGQTFPGEKSYASSTQQAPTSITPPTNPATGTAVGIGGAAPPPAGAQAPKVAGIVVPDIKSGSVSPALLTAAQISLPNRLGVSGPANVTGVNATGPTKSKPAGAAMSLLGLGALPVLAAIVAVILAARRRRLNAQLA